MPKPLHLCAAAADRFFWTAVRTIDKTRLGKQLGDLAGADMAAAETAVRQV